MTWLETSQKSCNVLSIKGIEWFWVIKCFWYLNIYVPTLTVTIRVESGYQMLIRGWYSFNQVCNWQHCSNSCCGFFMAIPMIAFP